MTDITVRVLISGRVQGGGYRDACAKQAKQLGLGGWVQNRDDGCVEALLCGEELAVRELIGWMHRGPELARVDDVDIAPAAETAPPPFRVKR